MLDGWAERSGPKYRRLCDAIIDAAEARVINTGDRLPSERSLADAVRVGRGTIVRAFDQLHTERVVTRRHGSGTYVMQRATWVSTPPETAASALLRRQMTRSDRSIDLSQAVPAGIGHLPSIAPSDLLTDLLADRAGHGLHPAGLESTREALARHLTDSVGLPTTPDQLIVTSGAQQALTLLAAAVVSRDRVVITGCPTYAGLPGAMRGRRLLGVPSDARGIDVQAVRTAASRLNSPVIYVETYGADPTGIVLATDRAEALLRTARHAGGVVIENFSQAGLGLDEEGVGGPPLAAHDDTVVAVGSMSKMFWAGLRIGWIRAPASLRAHLLRLRSAHDLAPSVPSQLLATQLLSAVDHDWTVHLRRTLRARRDHLLAALARELPAWRPTTPVAGLSMWVDLPITNSEPFTHLAARYQVIAAAGATHCVDNAHRNGLRLSFAHSADALDEALRRLAAAWEHHCRNLAVSL